MYVSCIVFLLVIFIVSFFQPSLFQFPLGYTNVSGLDSLKEQKYPRVTLNQL